MQYPLYWLTSQTVDSLVDDYLTLFDTIYREFLDIFVYKESLLIAGQEQKVISLIRT